MLNHIDTCDRLARLIRAEEERNRRRWMTLSPEHLDAVHQEYLDHLRHARPLHVPGLVRYLENCILRLTPVILRSHLLEHVPTSIADVIAFSY